MKIYRGSRTVQGACLVTVRQEGSNRELILNPRFDLRNHSPTGFEWGYAGSGPAQLALALLADVLQDDELAQEQYQEFKRRCVVNLPYDGWCMTDFQASVYLFDIRAARAVRRLAEEGDGA